MLQFTELCKIKNNTHTHTHTPPHTHTHTHTHTEFAAFYNIDFYLGYLYRDAGMDESEIRVGFVTYHKELHFYNVKVSSLVELFTVYFNCTQISFLTHMKNLSPCNDHC